MQCTHTLLQGLGDDMVTCDLCGNSLDDDERVLVCPHCDLDICSECATKKVVQDKLCPHPNGFTPQVRALMGNGVKTSHVCIQRCVPCVYVCVGGGGCVRACVCMCGHGV